MGDFNKIVTIHSQRVVRPPMIETNLVVVFFYGALQNGEKCGVGVVLKCTYGDIFSIKMDYGK